GGVVLERWAVVGEDDLLRSVATIDEQARPRPAEREREAAREEASDSERERCEPELRAIEPIGVDAHERSAETEIQGEAAAARDGRAAGRSGGAPPRRRRARRE